MENPHISSDEKELVNDIILATINHQIPKKLLDNDYTKAVASLFLDADLSVLGWDENLYRDYAWGIWREYDYYGR